MTARRSAIAVAALLLVGLALLLTATRLHGGPEADKVRAIGLALNGGARPDYVAAVAAVRRAAPTRQAGDAEAASLLLRSLADPTAATRPPGTIESGLRMMEAAAAAADPRHDASVIEATMRYGVAAPAGSPVLVPPSPRVANCWRRAALGTATGASCIALRRAG